MNAYVSLKQTKNQIKCIVLNVKHQKQLLPVDCYHCSYKLFASYNYCIILGVTSVSFVFSFCFRQEFCSFAPCTTLVRDTELLRRESCLQEKLDKVVRDAIRNQKLAGRCNTTLMLYIWSNCSLAGMFSGQSHRGGRPSIVTHGFRGYVLFFTLS